MTDVLGIDCATVITDPAAVKAAGKSFVVRYISSPGNPKNATTSEIAGLKTHGLELALVFENLGTRALDGHAAGVVDSASAEMQAKELGAPADAPIYFAVDFDMQPSQEAAVKAYFEGITSNLGKTRVGGYGGLRLVTMLGDDAVCKYLYQTYAWSGTPTVWYPKAQLRQYENDVVVAGVSCDLDHAMTTDYGQWNPPAAKPHVAGWTITYHDKDGTKHEAATKRPTMWQIAHPRHKYHGRLTIDPVMK